MRRFESSLKDESRAYLSDSSKAYGKFRALSRIILKQFFKDFCFDEADTAFI